MSVCYNSTTASQRVNFKILQECDEVGGKQTNSLKILADHPLRAHLQKYNNFERGTDFSNLSISVLDSEHAIIALVSISIEHVLTIMVTASLECSPLAVSPESISQSVPSRIVFLTSEHLARVGQASLLP